MFVLFIASISLLNAQARWLVGGQALYGTEPVENALIEIFLTPNGWQFPIYVDESKNLDNENYYLPLNPVLYNKLDFSHIKVKRTYKIGPHITLYDEYIHEYGKIDIPIESIQHYIEKD